MSLFSKGIRLEQRKEPMLSSDIVVMRQEYSFFTSPYAETPAEELSAEQIIEIARLAEIVDESDGKPLAEKLEAAKSRKNGTLIIDAIDDEPYVSSQMCITMHHTEKLALAIGLVSKVVCPKNCYVAVYKHISEVNMRIPKSIGGVRVERIGGLYPAEDRAYRHIPKGQDHLIVGACAMLHLARAVSENHKMTSCFITVAGDAVENPRNVEAPIGATVEKVLESCGFVEEPEVVVMGGPMTGRSVFDPEDRLVDIKTRAVLALTKNYKSFGYSCIGCGRCDHACPETLSVSRIRLLMEYGMTDGLEKYDPDHCIGCRACSYVCPARIDVASAVLKARRTVYDKKEGAK